MEGLALLGELAFPFVDLCRVRLEIETEATLLNVGDGRDRAGLKLVGFP
jgi:hypothetical protein